MPRFTVMMKKKIFLNFPVDMLRYDNCWPSTSEDSVKISWTLQNNLQTMEDNEISFMLGRGIELYTDNRSLTAKRWESFGWEVVS